MKKFIAILLTLLFTLPLTACDVENVVLDESKNYDINASVQSLDVDIKAADFKIVNGNAFSVKSNLKYLSVTQDDGVLKIVDKAKSTSNFANAELTISIPNNKTFNNVSISTGAAKITVDTLSSSNFVFKLGAGDVYIKNLNATSKIDIDGGAGRITIANSSLNNLTLDMGVGELNLTGALLGTSTLNFGIGQSNVNIIGIKDNYKLEVEKGIGSVTIDGENISNIVIGTSGQNSVIIKGGVGSININFQNK